MNIKCTTDEFSCFGFSACTQALGEFGMHYTSNDCWLCARLRPGSLVVDAAVVRTYNIILILSMQ
jgi:hypothetical protein